MSWRLGNGKLRKDQTDTYGKIRGGAKPLLSDFEDSDSIHFSQSASTSKIKAEITEVIMEIINNALLPTDLVTSEDITVTVDEGSISFILNESLKEKIEDSITAGDLKSGSSITKVIDAVDNKIKFEINSDILTKIQNSLTENDWESSATMTIGKNPLTNKLYGAIATDILNKINSSLQIPSQIATEKKLVGVGTSRNQIDVSMGETMDIDSNNKLNLKQELKEKVLGALSSSDLEDSEDITVEQDETTNKISFKLITALKTLIQNAVSFINIEDTEDITVSKDSSNKIHFNLDSDLKDKIDDSLVYSDLESSEEIIVDKDTETGKVNFTLDNTVSNKINNSLQTPLATPTSTELVGIDSSKAQQRITIGEGLAIVNNVLVATSSLIKLWENNNITTFNPQTITTMSFEDYRYLIFKIKSSTEEDAINYYIIDKNNIKGTISTSMNSDHLYDCSRSYEILANNQIAIGIEIHYWINGSSAQGSGNNNNNCIPLVIYATNNPIGNN